MKNFAGCTFAPWAGCRPFAPGRLLEYGRSQGNRLHRVASASYVVHFADGFQQGVKEFGLHPTPEGPFHEGNDLSAVCCKSILQINLWLNLFKFSVYELEQSKGRCIRARLRFFTEAQYSIVRTALHRDQFSFCELFDFPGYKFCDEYVNFECKCRFSGWLIGLANRQSSRPTIPLGLVRHVHATLKGLHQSCHSPS